MIIALLVIIAVTVSPGTAAKTDIWLGAIINSFDASGAPDSQGAQHLSAFLMAVREVNDKTDGLFDNLLPDYNLKFGVVQAHGFVGAVNAAHALDVKNPSPHVVVVSLSNKEAIPATDVLETTGTVMVSTRSTTAELSNGRDFPLKVRTCHSDSFTGYVLQRALLHLGFTRIAIFSTVDYFSSQSLEQLLSSDTSINSSHHRPNFEVLHSAILEPETDFSDAIAAAKSSHALVFVLLTDPGTTASLLVGGKQAGLFRVGSTILAHDVAVVPETIAAVAALDPSQPPAYYFSGFMGFSAKPNFAFFVTDVGQAFVKRFLKQQNTLSTCSTATDDYLESLFVKNGKCAGLDYSKFAADGSTLDPYLGNVYDAVIAVAMALDNIFYAQKISYTDFVAKEASLLMDTFINSVSFTGVTDVVSFNAGLLVKGKLSPAKIGYGDRDSGFTYRPSILNSDGTSFEEVGRWDVAGDWQLCDEHLLDELTGPLEPCTQTVVYNTADGKRGRDRYPDAIPRVPPGLVYFFVVIGALGLLMVALLSLYFFWQRNTGIVKSSQPPMMAMVLAGEAIIALRIIFSSLVNLDQPNSVWLCSSHVWFGHLGPCMVFGGLFLKMWRVDKIINTKSLKRVKITNQDILIMGVIATVVICVLLAILTGVGKPFVSLTVTTVDNTDIYTHECHEQVPEIEDALYGIEAFFIIWGIRLTNATKNAPSAVNESIYIAGATTVIIALAAVGLPLAHLVNLSPVNVEILATFLFIVGLFSTTAILFTQKVRDLLEDEGAHSMLKIKMKDVKKRVLGTMSLSGTGSGAGGAQQSAAFTTSEQKLASAATAALHGFTLDERFMMCQRQLEFWRTMLMAVEETRSSATGSSADTTAQSGYPSEMSAHISTMKPASLSHGHKTSGAVYIKNDSHSVESSALPEEDEGNDAHTDTNTGSVTTTHTNLQHVPEEEC